MLQPGRRATMLQTKGARSMPENKAVVFRWVDELWNKGNLAIVDELGAPAIKVYYPLTGELRGHDQVRRGVARLRSSFPDISFSPEGEVIGEGDYVAARWRAQATQQGALGSVPATGKPVSWMGISVFRLIEGKILEEIGEEGALSILEQLGVIPKQKLQ